MIANDKHFTKCETPNSSKIIEDKKHIAITTHKQTLTNGTLETNKGAKIDSKDNKMDENKITSTTNELKIVNGNATADKIESDDPNNLFNAPKYGTVIPNRIFVGGFSAKTADEDLWRFFSSFCHITAAKIIYDRAGVSKCYGFVTFANPKDAKSIVKQHGGVMNSPMGRLRIAQAVRKQMPMFPVEIDGSTPGAPATHYYHQIPQQLQPKSQPMCVPIAPYIPIPQGHVGKYSSHPPPTQSVSPHDSSSVTPESTSTGIVIQHPQQSHSSQQQITQCNNNNYTGHGKVMRYTSAVVPTQPMPQQQQRPPSAPVPPPQGAAGGPQMYTTPQGGMIAQYVIQTVAYPQTLPAYDATGLYTTCPGYATYPSYYMMAPPSYPHPHMGAMLPTYPAQPPMMNSFIY